MPKLGSWVQGSKVTLSGNKFFNLVLGKKIMAFLKDHNLSSKSLSFDQNFDKFIV